VLLLPHVCRFLSLTCSTSNAAASVIEELKSFNEGLTVKLDAIPGQFFVMVALCNRADHYIFILFLLSFFLLLFSSPNLSSRRLDVYHTSAHGVVLV